ncbi:MAG: Gfo/Idh/MocA family oxidoreductase [Chloroflexota bacterium]
MPQLNIGLIGAGLMGSFHGDTLANRLTGARLAAISDPVEAAANRVLAEIQRDDVRYEPDYQRLLADPTIDGVVIATPGRFHADVIVASAQAGKPTFCEKPIAHTAADASRAVEAAERARTILQIGFQRRFDPGYQRARRQIDEGALGDIHLLRSITRDPAVPRPEGALPWAIFLETLIHDFDALYWLAGSRPVEVFAQADARVWPRGQEGMLDTALVSIKYANGALATADSSFQSGYGYDVRAEVFGSAGMMTIGDGRLDSANHYSGTGVSRAQAYWFKDLFAVGYRAELQHFVDCVRNGTQPSVTGRDGQVSLATSLAAIESVKTGRPVSVSA